MIQVCGRVDVDVTVGERKGENVFFVQQVAGTTVTLQLLQPVKAEGGKQRRHTAPARIGGGDHMVSTGDLHQRVKMLCRHMDLVAGHHQQVVDAVALRGGRTQGNGVPMPCAHTRFRRTRTAGWMAESTVYTGA